MAGGGSKRCLFTTSCAPTAWLLTYSSADASWHQLGVRPVGAPSGTQVVLDSGEAVNTASHRNSAR